MTDVFSFNYGNEIIHADPLKVRRLLLKHTDGRAWTYMRDQASLKEDYAKLQKELGDSGPDAGIEAKLAVNRMALAELEGMLAVATVRAFELPPFNPQDGSGTTEMAALTLLAMYMEFASGKE